MSFKFKTSRRQRLSILALVLSLSLFFALAPAHKIYVQGAELPDIGQEDTETPAPISPAELPEEQAFSTEVEIAGDFSEVMGEKIFEFIQELRQNAGLPALARQEDMQRFARYRSLESLFWGKDSQLGFSSVEEELFTQGFYSEGEEGEEGAIESFLRDWLQDPEQLQVLLSPELESLSLAFFQTDATTGKFSLAVQFYPSAYSILQSEDGSTLEAVLPEQDNQLRLPEDFASLELVLEKQASESSSEIRYQVSSFIQDLAEENWPVIFQDEELQISQTTDGSPLPPEQYAIKDGVLSLYAPVEFSLELRLPVSQSELASPLSLSARTAAQLSAADFPPAPQAWDDWSLEPVPYSAEVKLAGSYLESSQMEAILEAVNRLREENGLSPLELATDWQALAAYRAQASIFWGQQSQVGLNTSEMELFYRITSESPEEVAANLWEDKATSALLLSPDFSKISLAAFKPAGPDTASYLALEFYPSPWELLLDEDGQLQMEFLPQDGKLRLPPGYGDIVLYAEAIPSEEESFSWQLQATLLGPHGENLPLDLASLKLELVDVSTGSSLVPESYNFEDDLLTVYTPGQFQLRLTNEDFSLQSPSQEIEAPLSNFPRVSQSIAVSEEASISASVSEAESLSAEVEASISASIEAAEESSRKAAEASAEASRQEAEESSRKAAEASAKASRQEAEESSRKAAEESAEASRQEAAESSRKAAEESAEASRQEAEESSRKAAEESAEASRQEAAESSRKAAEESAEASRQEAAESSRKAAEASAEASRQEAAESSRKAAEASAEASRQEAEESRKKAAEASIREEVESSIHASQEASRKAAAASSRKAAEASAAVSRQAAEESSKKAAEASIRQEVESSIRASQEASRRAAAESAQRSAQVASSQAAAASSRRAAEASAAVSRQAAEESRKKAAEASIRQEVESSIRASQEASRRAAEESAQRSAQSASSQAAAEASKRAAEVSRLSSLKASERQYLEASIKASAKASLQASERRAMEASVSAAASRAQAVSQERSLAESLRQAEQSASIRLNQQSTWKPHDPNMRPPQAGLATRSSRSEQSSAKTEMSSKVAQKTLIDESARRQKEQSDATAKYMLAAAVVLLAVALILFFYRLLLKKD